MLLLKYLETRLALGGLIDVMESTNTNSPHGTFWSKVIILVPHRDEHDYRQWRDWWHNGLQKPLGTLWLESRGLSLTTNRTKLVHEALKSDATHFFFLDDDVIAPDDVIPSFLAANLPIVCGLYMVDVSGLGCALIQRSIFERVPEPWFVWEPEGVSEDFFFFNKVFQTIGVKPVADMECRCLHIGVFALDTNNEFTTLGV